MLEVITKDRLKHFYAATCYLEKLKSELEEFKKNFNTLKSTNFEEIRVTSGSKKQSAEEMYLNCIESKMAKIRRFEDYVRKEKPIILTQISRITNPVYADILIDRYIKLKDWKMISLELFGSFGDYWIYRETKYHIATMTIHRRAVSTLEAISEKPFIPEGDKQLTLGV